jgi:hypothetical protein
MKYDRIVIAYHGCDAATVERLLRGVSFKKSQNDYDWLGEGIYFWEYGAHRALKFAHDQKALGKVTTPAIIGALVQLGHCFDLMDTRFTEELPLAFEMFKKHHRSTGRPMPSNSGKTPDKLLRRRDCAVLNYYLDELHHIGGETYDTIRCGFVEGAPGADRCATPCLRGRRLPAHNANMSTNGKKTKRRRSGSRQRSTPRARNVMPVLRLDPEAPGLDDETRRRRRVLAEMQNMSADDLFRSMVRAGIYTEDGELTAPYRSEEPSAYRPTD